MGEGGFALPKDYIFHLFLPKIIFHLSNDDILPLQISYFVFPNIIVLLSKDCILSFQKYWFVSSNQKVWFVHKNLKSSFYCCFLSEQKVYMVCPQSIYIDLIFFFNSPFKGFAFNLRSKPASPQKGKSIKETVNFWFIDC